MNRTKFTLYVGDHSGDGHHDMIVTTHHWTSKMADVDGFTVIPTVGAWKGESELSLMIEIIGHLYNYSDVMGLAEALRLALGQACVLVTHHEINVAEVTG